MTPSLERFFLDEKNLPILGTSALEQFLDQESERMRMSPDSTMNHIESSSIRSESSSNGDSQVPDSTTSDMAYDSDAFNSEDSCSSFAEAQQMQQIANPSNANLLLLPQNTVSFGDFKKLFKSEESF